MAWRVDVRTPRVLANALEKLADLAKDQDENDAAPPAIAKTPGVTGKSTSGTEEDGISQKSTATRQEMLARGEEVS